MGGVRECQTGGVLTNWRERMRVRAESKKQGHVDFRVRGLDRVYTRAIVSFMSTTETARIRLARRSDMPAAGIRTLTVWIERSSMESARRTIEAFRFVEDLVIAQWDEARVQWVEVAA